MPPTAHLDGKTLEGGGQLIRIALGLSALTSTRLLITDIRGNRPGGGGLKPQHLTAVTWLARACAAEVAGAEVKSKTLQFRPAKSKKSRYSTWFHERTLPDGTEARACEIDMSSPGSIGLIFQAILPFVMFTAPAREEAAPVLLSIEGGTNVSFSPSYDYIAQVLLPNLALAGLPPISAILASRGWSTGRPEIGSVSYHITPLAPGTLLPAFNFQDRGNISSIVATILAPSAVLSTMRIEVLSSLSRTFPDIPATIAMTEDSRHSARFYLLLVASTTAGYKLGTDLLYPHKVKSPTETATKLIGWVISDLQREIEHVGCVDAYMQDQLVIYQALAKGRSVVDAGREIGTIREPSLHTKTARWVAKEILGVEFDDEGGCEGIGFVVGGEKPAGRVKEYDVLATGDDEEDEMYEKLARLELKHNT